MKIFDKMYSFFESLVEYTKNFSNLFLIFIGAFLLVSVVVIIMTSFAYECKLTKTIDRINKFLERNPRINDDNLVAFNNMMKAGSVPKTLRRQWQQFMLYREHPASYYMSFKHCVENPLRNSTYSQQMTVYKVISLVLVALSLMVGTFMTVEGVNTSRVLMDILIIPVSILVLYWLISMVLNLIHSAVSGDLFQNYQYFEINMDKAMLTLPEFVDYEVLFSQDEIRRGIPVLFAYLQKRAIQEQQELEKARLKSVDHEKFDFDSAGLDGSLVLDRAMRETENYTTQRKKYMQETERVNNEIAVLENNYKEQTKEFQRQVQTSKETVENLKEQLEQATSTIEINYIKKQMRDEINRQQLSEKEFDILTDRHNQAVKALNQEIKHYDEETKKAKEAMEVAMLSEFNTYSIKVYDNLEKIVDERMQERVDDYKDQIKGLEVELEEKNEELENVYTRYQEALSQIPEDEEPEQIVEELPIKKGKRKKKNDDIPADDAMVQPEQVDENYSQFDQYAYEEQVQPEQQYDDNQQYYADDYNAQSYVDNTQDYQNEDYYGYDDYANGEYVQPVDNYDNNYVPAEEEQAYNPLENEGYVPLQDEYNENAEQYIPLESDEYAQSDEYSQYGDYVPLNDYSQEGFVDGTYVPLDNQADEPVYLNQEYVMADEEPVVEESVGAVKEDVLFDLDDEFNDSNNLNDADFNLDFNKSTKISDFDDMKFDFDFEDTAKEAKEEDNEPLIDDVEDDDFDLNKVLGLYDDVTSKPIKEEKVDDETVSDDLVNSEEEDDKIEVAPKRKAGRPRKIVDETEIAPKRSVGRPRKEYVEEAEVAPKRKAGRPRKVVDETEVAPKRSVGRPRKETSINVEPKRKAGRPRKVVEETEPKRNVGRPRKVVEETAPKRNVGRPRKEDVVVATSTGKRGRPRKEEVAPKTSTGKRGRPSKASTSAVSSQGILGKPVRKAGRPRKSEK